MCQEAPETDTDEAPRRQVSLEAPEEGGRRQTVDSLSIAVGTILPRKPDGFAIVIDDPFRVDGDAVDVSREIAHQCMRAGERSLQVQALLSLSQSEERMAKGMSFSPIRREVGPCSLSVGIEQTVYK